MKNLHLFFSRPWCRLLSLALLCTTTGTTWSAPYLPASDATVLEQLPFRARSTTGQELAGLRRAHLQAPTNAEAAAALANRYFELALERGDPRYVGQANAVVEKVMPPLSAELLLVRGKLRQYRHGFADALQDFADALKLKPDFAEAHSWRAAILMVQADYAAARLECAALQRLERNSLAQGCLGLVQAYTGDLASAHATLERALSGTRSVGNQLWLLTRLAEVAAWRKQPELAEKHYLAALALARDDSYLLAARADFLLDQKRPAEVITLLQDWEAVDGLLLRLTLAEAQLHRSVFKVRLRTLAERFAAAQARGDTTHQAEEARFHLVLREDEDTALRLAVDNFKVQREPRDARVVLEAALAKSAPQAAEPVFEWLARSGFQDVHIIALASQLKAMESPKVRR